MAVKRNRRTPSIAVRAEHNGPPGTGIGKHAAHKSNGHSHRINIAGIRLGAKVKPFANTGIYLHEYTNECLVDLIMIYRCMRSHPDFTDRQFENVHDAINYLTSEMTRLMGSDANIAYTWYKDYHHHGDSAKCIWPDKTITQSPAVVALSGCSDSGMDFPNVLWLELKAINHPYNALIRPVFIMALSLMRNYMNFKWATEHDDACYMDEEAFLLEKIPEYIEYGENLQTWQEAEQSMKEGIREMRLVKHEIARTLIGPAFKELEKVIRTSKYNNCKLDPALVEWLQLIHILCAKEFKITDYDVAGFVESDDMLPLRAICKIGFVWDNEWPVYGDLLQYMPDIANNGGEIPLFAGNILSPTGFIPALKSTRSMIDDLHKLFTFELNRQLWHPSEKQLKGPLKGILPPSLISSEKITT